MSRLCSFALVICTMCSPVVACDELKVGVAVADITPPPGYRMSGYYSERLSTGMHDPLQAKAVVFNQGDEWAGLVFCDLIGLPREMSSRVRELAAESTGIPASKLLIAATHSHTGPLYYGALRKHFHDLAASKNGGEDPHEEVDFQGELVAKLVDVIGRAKHVAKPVRLEIGVAAERRLSFNRRFHMKDGTVVFNPGKLNANIVRPAGPIDPDVAVLLMRDAEKTPIAALTVFALHLDTVGGTEYAADFPSYLERELHELLGSEVVSIFGTGTCGDLNHVDVSHDRPQKGHTEAERIGTALAETVKTSLPKLRPIQKPSLLFRTETVEVPLQKYSHEDIAQARKDIHKVGTRDLPFLKQVEATKIVSLAMLEASVLPMDVQVLRLSDDAAIVGLPGEIFVELGLAIKQASPFKTTIVVELCNDAPGYVPTRKAFAEGSYETINSRVQPGGGEMLVETALRLLKELKGEAE